jgi:hypothetical protein
MKQGACIELMIRAIAETDGSEAEALVMFEIHLLARNNPQLVWDLFAPVRAVVLRRLYDMAKYQADSDARPNLHLDTNVATGTASEPYETADSSTAPLNLHKNGQHSTVSDFDHRRRITPSRTRQSRSPRGARSAQDVIISIGGKKSHLDWLTNHRGIPIGDLTYYGLANAHDEAPLFQRFAARLMDEGIPKSDRGSDVVRRFITPDQADRIWLELLKEVA